MAVNVLAKQINVCAFDLHKHWHVYRDISKVPTRFYIAPISTEHKTSVIWVLKYMRRKWAYRTSGECCIIGHGKRAVHQQKHQYMLLKG